MPNIKRLTKIWDKEAKSYSFEKNTQVDYLANYYHLVNCLGKVDGKTILEVGSGTGQASAYLAARGGLVHLVDISREALNFSKSFFASQNLHVKLYQQDAFAMKFANEKFDYVWNGGVIEHFSDSEKVLMIKKMWKLVKPGGKLLITVPNARDFPFMVAKKILELRKKWAFGQEDDLTIRRMRILAKAAGISKFTIYAYNPIVGFWFFPYGHEITNWLGLNTFKNHKSKSRFGHVIIFCAQRPFNIRRALQKDM